MSTWVKERIKNETLGILAILIAILVIFSCLSASFITINNLFLIIRNFTIFGIMAIGQSLIIITGGIDLAVGSTFGITGLITALCLMEYNLSVTASIIIGLSSGLLIGCVNGLLVVKAKLAPFIATFGMLSVVRGFAFALSQGMTVTIDRPEFTKIGMAYLGPIPIPVIILAAFAIVFHLVLSRTTFGRRIYAVGGNETAARFSGIRVSAVRFLTYMIMGGLCGVAGIVSAAKAGLGTSMAGGGYELDVITAAVVGGVSLKGGKGNIIGVMIGAAIMGSLKNGLLLLDVSTYWQTTVTGLVIIGVLALDVLRNRASGK